jgi:D-glycerate 3-kinase
MNLIWQQYIAEAQSHLLWNRLKPLLVQQLPPPIKRPELVDNYYLPLFLYLHDQVKMAGVRTFVVGINAPQGGGKSTLTAYLVQLFDWCGIKAVTLSIDDFYLTRAQQVRLASDNPDNTYLQQRGYPGTHDIDLGTEVLTRLKKPESPDQLQLPKYDKSCHKGQGDRAEQSSWPIVQLPVDVVLLEGWMLGFQPLAPDQITDNQLGKINSLLSDYDQWHQFLDSFVYLCPENPGFVVDWRSEAEQRMKAQGFAGMSSAEVQAYAKKFLPAYQLYGPHLATNPPTPLSFLQLIVGKNRLPLHDHN